MKDFRYVTDNEIACHDFETATKIAELLVKENYVVMLSSEENLTIVNYLFGGLNQADRNEVCFQSRELVEDFIYNVEDEENDDY